MYTHWKYVLFYPSWKGTWLQFLTYDYCFVKVLFIFIYSDNPTEEPVVRGCLPLPSTVPQPLAAGTQEDRRSRVKWEFLDGQALKLLNIYFFHCEKLQGSAENRFTATRPLRRDPFPPSRAEARKWRRGPAGGRPLPQRLPGASQPRGPLSASRASEGEPRPVATPPLHLATPTSIKSNAG